MSSDRVAIVTGAASQIGIGFAIASRLIKEGWKVTVADINESEGQTAAKSLGSNAYFVAVDVMDFKSVVTLFEANEKKWGKIDYVGANAGYLVPASTFDFYAPPKTSKDGVMQPPNLKDFEVCGIGAFNTVYAAIQYLRKNQDGGLITVTSSGAGLYPLAYCAPYAAGKHSNIGLVRSLAPKLIEENIRINAVSPCLVGTNLGKHLLEHVDQSLATPASTVASAVWLYISDPRLAGCVAECTGKTLYFHDPPSYRNDVMEHLITLSYGPLKRPSDVADHVDV